MLWLDFSLHPRTFMFGVFWSAFTTKTGTWLFMLANNQSTGKYTIFTLCHQLFYELHFIYFAFWYVLSLISSCSVCLSWCLSFFLSFLSFFYNLYHYLHLSLPNFRFWHKVNSFSSSSCPRTTATSPNF